MIVSSYEARVFWVRRDLALGGSVSVTLQTRASASMSRMKVRDALRLLSDDGWVVHRTRGSHRQLKHPTKPGLVTIAGSGNDDLARRTLKSILKQAGLSDRAKE